MDEYFATVKMLINTIIAGWGPKQLDVGRQSNYIGHPLGVSGARVLIHLIDTFTILWRRYCIVGQMGGGAQGKTMLVKVG